MTEDANRTIFLGDGAELDVEGRDAGIAVVLEETPELRPDVACRGTVLDDEVEQLGGDARVQPLNPGEIFFEPTRIVRLGRRGVGDVVKQRAEAEVDLEQVAPVVVVPAMEITNNGDEGGNQ